MIAYAELEELRPCLTVIGVGGAGNNAVAAMIRKGMAGVVPIAANTDAQALNVSPAPNILQLGRSATLGLGAGSDPALGRLAAEESKAELERLLDGCDLCFVAAGMGGGTGTGAAPTVAETARKLGILTVGVVTTPFAFEGRRRIHVAEKGLEELARHVDSLIVIPNQNLFRIAGPDTSLKSAFALADDILCQGVRSIADLITYSGCVNLDFADVRTILANNGRGRFGTGQASGENRAARAAELALVDPLLDDEIKGARGLLVSIAGGDDMLLSEVDEAASHVTALVDGDADIIWGSIHDPDLEGSIRVSVVAAGLKDPSDRCAALSPGPLFASRRDRALPKPDEAGPFDPEPAAEQEIPVLSLESQDPPGCAREDDGEGFERPPSVESEKTASSADREDIAPPGRRPTLFERMAGASRSRAADGRERATERQAA